MRKLMAEPGKPGAWEDMLQMVRSTLRKACLEMRDRTHAAGTAPPDGKIHSTPAAGTYSCVKDGRIFEHRCQSARRMTRRQAESSGAAVETAAAAFPAILVQLLDERTLLLLSAMAFAALSMAFGNDQQPGNVLGGRTALKTAFPPLLMDLHAAMHRRPQLVRAVEAAFHRPRRFRSATWRLKLAPQPAAPCLRRLQLRRRSGLQAASLTRQHPRMMSSTHALMESQLCTQLVRETVALVARSGMDPGLPAVKALLPAAITLADASPAAAEARNRGASGGVIWPPYAAAGITAPHAMQPLSGGLRDALLAVWLLACREARDMIDGRGADATVRTYSAARVARKEK